MPLVAQAIASGRYLIFHEGRECGEERWRLESAGEGLVATGEQVVWAPHPFPNRQEFRVTLALTPRWRVSGLEVLWTVGARTLRAIHAADAARWRARVEAEGHAREQEGDYPDFCEVDFGSHLFGMITLGRYSFQPGSELEYPVLAIGPPAMAVTPDQRRLRCVEAGERDLPFGRVKARRFEESNPSRPDEGGYSFWADEHDVVIESYEGLDASQPWMRLVEYRRG
jgi:hypothetical protein